MQHIFRLITALVVTAIIMGVLYIQSSEYLKVQQFKAQSEAVDGCLAASTYTYNNIETGVTTVEPIEKTYLKCLELKSQK